MQQTNCDNLYKMSIKNEWLPSRFIKENRYYNPYLMRNCTDSDYDNSIEAADSCYNKALKGEAEAAERVCQFFQNLRQLPGPVPLHSPTFEITKYYIAKRFAKIAAEGGRSSSYLYLTSMDYGAGKEMVEYTRWSIKDFSKSLTSTKDRRLDWMGFRLLLLLEPRYIDKKDTAIIGKFISDRYKEDTFVSFEGNTIIRAITAVMLERGFFGDTEKNDEKAFRIACKECVLCEKDIPTIPGYAGRYVNYWARSALYDLAKKRGYPSLGGLKEWEFVPNEKINVLKIIQQSTSLLQFYNIIPEQISKQFELNNKQYYIDLHGCKAKDSEKKVKQILDYMILLGDKVQSYKIITGKGNHSPNNQPVLKPLIHGLLKTASKTYPIEYNLDSGGGAFKVWKK